jgi:hypothetical protein
MRTFIVSFPRSGHHYTVNLLDKLFGIGNDYCELYRCVNSKNHKIMCPAFFLRPWLKVPCRASRTYQKNHDFTLKLAFKPQYRYVVMYRYPLESICSHYSLWRERRNWRANAPFKEFARTRIDYWNGFMTKWVLENQSAPNKFVLKYEDIVRDIESALALIRFLELDNDLPSIMSELEKHYQLQENRPIKKLNSYSFYDEAFFAQLEEAIDPRIWHVAGLEKRFSSRSLPKATSA